MIYYISIDISKYKYGFCIITNTNKVIVENSSFENNKKRISIFIGAIEIL